MADATTKIRLSQKEVKTFSELKGMGGVHVPVFKDKTNYYKLPLSELEELANKNIIVLPYEAATYTQINEYTQSGKQVIIYYMGVDDDQFWTLSHKTAESSYVFTWLNGNSLVKMTLSSGGVWSEEVINLKAIKDNAYDSVTNPTHPDNITDINELTFFRNQDSGANYPILSSEERTYGILIPAPQLEADQGKVPVYKVGDKIKWENVLNEAPDDGLSYARTSKAWNAIGSSIDITDDFELINGMSTNDVGDVGRFKVIYVPSTDMVQIVGNFFSPSIKPYDSWVPCMKYTGDFLSFNSVDGSQMNVGLGQPPNYISFCSCYLSFRQSNYQSTCNKWESAIFFNICNFICLYY
jgi:hypothetical protein